MGAPLQRGRMIILIRAEAPEKMGLQSNGIAVVLRISPAAPAHGRRRPC